MMLTKTATAYTIQSESGKTYEITHASPHGCDDVHIWSCNCPAGQRGRDCKHVRAFLSWLGGYCDVCDEWRTEDCQCIGPWEIA